MTVKGHFNFRDVAHALGLDMSKRSNWRLGQILVGFAREQGIEPERVLSEKTDPKPSVKAPHCIAHYPAHLFPDACSYVREVMEHERRQGVLF